MYIIQINGFKLLYVSAKPYYISIMHVYGATDITDHPY